jgi:hypothetical protein
MTALGNRLARLEERSPWGTDAELAASPLLIMRIPADGEGDDRLRDALHRAQARRQILRTTSSPLADTLPSWRPVPVHRIPDDLLDHLIAEAQAVVGAEAQS